MRKNYFLGLLFGGIFCVFSVTSCSKVATPKPYGYYRITLPDTSYVDFETLYPDYPYTFDLSQNAVVQPRNDEPYWINVYYPALDATIHCSYKSVHRNLRELSDDALEFVYRNASFANAIPEREIPLRPASSLSPIPSAISSGLRCIAIARRMPTPSPRYITICAPM